MEIIRELRRFTSPFPQPQALYVDGPTLWMTSRLTRRLYAVDLASGRVTWETAVPGTATGWGITMKGGDLYVVCGTDATGIDDRVIRRCVPGQGFDPAFSWACPEGMGSHLSFTGESLVLSQWYPRKLVYFDPAGRPGRELTAPHGICGHCFAAGAFWLATTDAEETNEYFLTRIDPTTGRAADVARLGFPARALASDGKNFWTNHRERNEIVCFAWPA